MGFEPMRTCVQWILTPLYILGFPLNHFGKLTSVPCGPAAEDQAPGHFCRNALGYPAPTVLVQHQQYLNCLDQAPHSVQEQGLFWEVSPGPLAPSERESCHLTKQPVDQCLPGTPKILSMQVTLLPSRGALRLAGQYFQESGPSGAAWARSFLGWGCGAGHTSTKPSPGTT